MPIVKNVSVIKDRNSSAASKGANGLIDYIHDQIKRPDTVVSNLLTYADNKNKNYNNNDFVSTLNGLSRNTDVAKKQFKLTRESRLREKNLVNRKERKNSRYLYHFVVSFNKYDTEKFNWKDLHKFSEEVAKEICNDEYQAFLSSHLPSSDDSNDYFHTHIVVNAYSKKEKGNKLHMDNGYVEKLISRTNELAKKYGYSLVTDPEKNKNKNPDKKWYEHYHYKKNSSWKENLRNAIDYAKENSKDLDDFLNKIQELGYRVRYENKKTKRQYKDISFIPGENHKEKKSVRGSRLGKRYSRSSLEDYFNLSKEERIEIKNKEAEAQLKNIKFEEQKNKKLEKEIYKNISYNGRLRKIKIFDKNKNMKTELEMKLELEYHDRLDNKVEDPSYMQELFDSLSFVSALKIENVDQLQEKILEKDKLLGKFNYQKKNFLKILDSYNAYLEYFKMAEEFGKLKEVEKESSISKQGLEKLIVKTKNELKEIERNLESLKVYARDLNKTIKFYDYKGTVKDFKYKQERYKYREQKRKREEAKREDKYVR